jgi:hypothetical protein
MGAAGSQSQQWHGKHAEQQVQVSEVGRSVAEARLDNDVSSDARERDDMHSWNWSRLILDCFGCKKHETRQGETTASGAGWTPTSGLDGPIFGPCCPVLGWLEDGCAVMCTETSEPRHPSKKVAVTLVGRPPCLVDTHTHTHIHTHFTSSHFTYLANYFLCHLLVDPQDKHRTHTHTHNERQHQRRRRRREGYA